jgi:hypothetical protein
MVSPCIISIACDSMGHHKSPRFLNEIPASATYLRKEGFGGRGYVELVIKTSD